MEAPSTEIPSAAESVDIWPLLIAESTLLFIALVALPIYAACKSKGQHSPSLKGLALPQGSVRSMLALTVVGSFVVFLVFGGPVFSEDDRFTEIVAALTGVAGTIIGFYFGSKGSGN